MTAAPPDVAARLSELHSRVHRPTGPEVDVAAIVRSEIERQRRAEAAERERVETARFAGGPCWACGTTTAVAIDEDGSRSADWFTTPRGQQCGWCRDWQGEGGPDELMDKVAAIIRDEGVEGLAVLDRLGFRWSPGIAQELGVVPWADSGGSSSGVRWGHLRDLQIERVDVNRPTIGDLFAQLPEYAAEAYLAGLESEHAELLDIIASPGTGVFGNNRRIAAEARLVVVERELAERGISVEAAP